ncbi:MAG: hypothetical protein P8N50_11515, partial [Actinomycetota bacterium]|nr:hypothetical protein [Actinomycetota bacterium]
AAKVEMVAAVAWPGIRTNAYGSWCHRLANGYTKRASSTTVVSVVEVELGLCVCLTHTGRGCRRTAYRSLRFVDVGYTFCR